MKHLIETTDLNSLPIVEYDRLILDSTANEIIVKGGGYEYELVTDSYIYNEADNKYYQKLVAYGEPIEANATVDLNSQWASDTTDDEYRYFKSTFYKTEENLSFSQCKVTWYGPTSVTFKYMSSSDTGVLFVLKLDSEKFTPPASFDDICLTTEGTTPGTYNEFTIECDEGEHHIWFGYAKMEGATDEDRGFIGVPKSVTPILDVKQGSELPKKYKYGGVSAEVDKTYDININNVTLPNGNIVTDVEKTEKTITYEYVDLGLESGTLWAKCNIGASSETEDGVFFQWGETSGVSESLMGKYSDEEYTWESYTLCNGSYNTMTKYCTNGSYGTVDDKTTLEPVDDAATQIMGGNWRMSTASEYQKLYDETLWVWCPGGNVGIKKTDESGNESIEYIAYPSGYFVFKTNSDKKQIGTFTKDEDGKLIGYTATSNTVYYPGAHEVTEGDVTSIADGDTHIFFTANGNAGGPGVGNRGVYGNYWSSSLHPSDSLSGLNLGFSSSYVGPQDYDHRDFGFCVRGVRK